MNSNKVKRREVEGGERDGGTGMESEEMKEKKLKLFTTLGLGSISNIAMATQRQILQTTSLSKEKARLIVEYFRK